MFVFIFNEDRESITVGKKLDVKPLRLFPSLNYFADADS